MKQKKIRVLVVDDSALMRKKISAMINASSDLEVIATARDGEEALKITEVLTPDVIVLDIQLPKMDGLTCLTHIMRKMPTAVVILSAFTQKGSENAIKALQAGAIEIVPKPDGVISLGIDKITDELLSKLRLAASIPKANLPVPCLDKIKKISTSINKSYDKIIAIGASTGGPATLTEILANLPREISSGILIIQHMPKFFIKAFAERLNQQSELTVKEAEDGEAILASKVLIAPAEFEMTVIQEHTGYFIKLEEERNKLHYLSPSIDKTFSSVAAVFKNNSIGLILTGMGRDGTEGCRKIKEAGGVTFAEDKSSCVVFGMPGSAIAAGVIDEIVPLKKIPAALLLKVGRSCGK